MSTTTATTQIQTAVLAALREGKLVDTDYGTEAIGAGRDVEDYDLRAIVEELADLITETPDVAAVGDLAYGVVWQVIDRHHLGGETSTTTTQLHGFGSYTTSVTVEDFVVGYLDEFADDYDVDGLVHAFRERVNNELAGTGISLHGDDFYSTVPVRDDAADLIRNAIHSPELAELAARFDLSGAVAMTVSSSATGERREITRTPFILDGSVTASRWIEYMGELYADPAIGLIAGSTYQVELVDQDDNVIVSVDAVAQDH